MVLKDLEPKSVFYFFEKLTKIPRESGNEQEVSQYIVDFAKSRDLEYYQDEWYNVIVKKGATKGYEDAPTVIIQGHIDMVCEKNMDKVFDFEKDPIELVVKDDFITSNQTTLGADNGIAVAYALALLDSKTITHPPLEMIFTTDEEVGMKGALKLDTSVLKGKYFINLDTEEEGELLVSCAGGLKSYINLSKEYDTNKEAHTYKILIHGLKGGHSGMEIDKNRANANELLGRLLYQLQHAMAFSIADIGGGLKDNAIPREAFVTITTHTTHEENLIELVKGLDTAFKNEYKTSDPEINIHIEKINETFTQVFSKTLQEKLIFLLLNLPNGIQTMSADIEGLVESSLNFGVLINDTDVIKLVFALRSSVKSLLYYMRDQIKSFADYVEGECIQTAEYPEWAYNKDSKLRELFVKVYEEMYQQKPLIKAIHAGLECGVFAEKIDDLDLISIGPDMFEVHTPNEQLSISSTKRTWEYLLEVLKNFNTLQED